MRTLVTGATGTVGGAVVQQLLAGKREVRALVRDAKRARPLVPEAVELIEGDVTDAAACARAVAGCGAVYHTAGLPEQWLRDHTQFTRVNVDGSRNLGEAAGRRGHGAQHRRVSRPRLAGVVDGTHARRGPAPTRVAGAVTGSSRTGRHRGCSLGAA